MAAPSLTDTHCKAEPDVTRRIVERGHFLGITPEVAYSERDQRFVREVPLTALVLESDGPREYGGEFAGRSGEPAMVGRAAHAIAEELRLPADEALATLSGNVRRCFTAT